MRGCAVTGADVIVGLLAIFQVPGRVFGWVAGLVWGFILLCGVTLTKPPRWCLPSRRGGGGPGRSSVRGRRCG